MAKMTKSAPTKGGLFGKSAATPAPVKGGKMTKGGKC